MSIRIIQKFFSFTILTNLKTKLPPKMNASSSLIPSLSCFRRQASGASNDGRKTLLPTIIQSHSKGDIQDTIQVTRFQEKLTRERDTAKLKAQLLKVQLDAARKELQETCNKNVEKVKLHQKRDMNTFVVDTKKKTNTSSTRMQSLIGTRTTTDEKVEKRQECQQAIIGKYVIGALLGKGAFGKVYSGTHSDTKTECAIKMFPKRKLKKNQVANIEQEIAVMKVCRHNNIVRFYQVMETPNLICLVMELGHLDLYSWVHYQKNNGYNLDPQVCREIILGICKAMKHLHMLGIAHLDVKEDNILVSKDVSIDELRQEHIKLCDFGLCDYSSNGFVESSGFIGTRGYFAPEMASDEDYDAQAADMFSVGCTFLSLVDKVPNDWSKAYQLVSESKGSFQNRIRVLIMMLQCDDRHLNGVVYPIAQIIRRLLMYDPDERLTAEEVLSHPWLAE